MGIPPIIRPRPGVDLGGVADVTLRTRLAEIVSERDQLAGRVEPLEREVQSVRGEAEATRTQNATLVKNNAELQTQLSRHAADLSARDSELATLRANDAVGRRAVVEREQLSRTVASLNDAIKARDDSIARHLAEIAELKTRPPEPASGGTLLTISKVATTVAEQVSTAQTAIRSAGGFTLSNVSVRLKGVTEGDASKIRILGASELRNPGLAGALDEINFDFAASPGAAPVAADKVAVPNLIGLTRLAAQRALTTVGLRLDAATGKPPANAKVAGGQAFKQSPEPTALADRGIAVLVVFAQ